MKFEKLFSPLKIRDLELPNRVIMTGMGTNMVSRDGSITDTLIEYHKIRAKGGVGMNFLEVASVYGKSAPVNFAAIWDDCYIPGHKKLTEAVHEAGGRVGIQLWQAGKGVGWDRNIPSCVPVDMCNRYGVLNKALTIEEIKEIASSYGQAAARAVKAGYDAIEFHSGHNYLPHMFLSAAFNKREDEYGGTLENRARFPLEIIREIRRNIPEGMPLFMRIVAFDDYLENGLTIDDVIQYCKWAGESGVDVLNVSRGNTAGNGNKLETPSIYMPQGFNVENAAKIKAATGMITMAVGRINRPEQAETYLQEGKADLVAMARAQLADPEFCNKARAGKEETIVHCIGCDQGCHDYFVDRSKPHITCMMNPFVGEERLLSLRAGFPKSIIVAGGGVAGMKATLFLNRMGYRVVLCEKGKELGGQFVTAGCAPGKEELKIAAKEMKEAILRENIDVRMNCSLNQKIMDEIQPDHVVIAIGSVPFVLPLPGVENENVHISHDVLRGHKKIEGRAAIIGGGLVGVEVAEYLLEEGCQVSIIEMLPEIAGNLGMMRRIPVMEYLEEHGAQIYTETKCIAIREKGVEVEQKGEKKLIEADGIVMAIGSKSRDTKELENLCAYNDVAYTVIGDAKKARNALDAIREAWQLSLEL